MSGVRLAAVLAGAAWAIYGAFAMLTPWGPDLAYDDRLGYEVVTERGLFTLYRLPGALAMAASGAALLGSARRAGGKPRAAILVSSCVVGLGLVSAGGVVTGAAPVAAAPVMAGVVVLAVAAFVAGAAERRAAMPSWRITVALGAGALAFLPLWPLVYALEWVPEAMGAVWIGAYGALWVARGMQGRPATS